MDSIVRRKVRGRQVARSPLSWPGLGPMFAATKRKSVADSPIAPGYKHVGIVKIPIRHQSYKPLQDRVDRQMQEEIRRTPPGRRKDFLIRSYNYWVQNGRPTYGSPGKRSRKNDWTRTQAKGLGVWADGVTDDRPTRTKRLKAADVTGVDPE